MSGALWILLAACAGEASRNAVVSAEPTTPTTPTVAPVDPLVSAASPSPDPLDVLAALEGRLAAGEEPDLAPVLTLGLEELRPALTARAAARERDDAGRRLDLRVLAEVGWSEDLELALRLAPSAAAGRAELESAVAAILARDPAGRQRATRLALHAPAELAPTMVRAVAATGVQAQAELAGMLGLTLDLDLAVLSALVGNLRAEGAGADAGEVAAAVRPFLVDDDPQLAREAAAAIGALGDAESIPALVDLLEFGDARAAPAAHAALLTLTGLAWGAEPDRWRAWLRAESEWFETRAASLFEDLGDTPAQRALAALGELGGHRYRRDEIGREILVALAHVSPEVRVAACATLERLGWEGATAPLVELLAHEGPAVVAGAGRALRALTGLDHADDDLDAWRGAVR